jgi:hypothetical protein
MPRYRKKHIGQFKPLHHPHQFSYFLGSLSDEQFKQFQNHEVSHPGVHPGAYKDARTSTRLQIIHAISAEHKAAQRGELVGGGLGDALNSIGNALYNVAIKPFQVPWNLAANLVAPLTHGSTVSEHTQLIASAVKQSYIKDETERADYVGDLIRDPALSTSYTDVWVNKGSKPDFVLMSVRGTQDAKDVGEDFKLAFSGRSDNLIGMDIGKMLKKYPDSHVELAGHSLGTQLIAEALIDHPDLYDQIEKINLFNPASSPLIEGAVQKMSDDSKTFFFENQADLVGLGQMMWAEPPKNLVMKTIRSINPAENHTIDQWLPSEAYDTGQLTSDQTENILSGETQWNRDASFFEENSTPVYPNEQ